MRNKQVLVVLGILVLIIICIWKVGTHFDQKGNHVDKVITEEQSLPTDVAEEIEEAKAYISTTHYIDDELYAAIKEIYDEIDFSGEFNQGDYAKYDLYKRQYKKMMDGEVKIKVKDPETDKEKYEYLYELGEFRDAIKHEAGGEPQEYYEKECIYYFFDMDGDNNPELFITNNRRFTYIFKYEEESDQIVMWDEIISSHIFFYGTLKFGFMGGWTEQGGVIDGLIGLDSSGDYIFFVRFKTAYPQIQNSLEDYDCFVALPDHMEPGDWMKSQAVYDNVDESYYFQVTQEQFYELTGEYYRMKESYDERIKEMTYAYEELFDSK
ncbi:MAG: hypothetical protein NC092_05685 [Butyrivibrio sp.]|nr:hypothetical protein [Muribaculum sp.]MCM1552167.1 hypothetical protein [Butyrivibrio sp.]